MQLHDRRLFWWFLGLSVWGVFTVSLATWWYIFVLREIQLQGSGTAVSPIEFARKVTMIKFEGLALVASLLAMIGVTGTLIYRELRRSREIRRFFLTFSHELKTPLASLRLQAESLAEDLNQSGGQENRYLSRLIQDTERLELQLENSLLLSSLESDRAVHKEPLDLLSALQAAAREVSEVRIQLDLKVGSIVADRRAVNTILRNLFHNASVHGHASVVTCSSESNQDFTVLRITDNGIGVDLPPKNRKMLGNLFFRPKGGSGNGIGLYLSKILMRRMGGRMIIPAPSVNGFSVELWFRAKDG